MRSKVIALMGILLLPACGTESTQRPGSEAAPGAAAAAPAQVAAPEGDPGRRHTVKPGAPVDITAQIGQGAGTITIVFRSAASDVSVKLGGIDGLVVQGEAAPISGRAFVAGDRVEIPASYTAPVGAALTVSVSGTFGSRRLGRVKSFAVGGPPAPAAAPGEIRTDAAGRKVRVMPAQ